MDEERFLHEVAIRMGIEAMDTRKIVTAVLRQLHDRLTPKEVGDLGAQLPGTIKHAWQMFETPGGGFRRTHKADFIRNICEEAGIGEEEARRAMLAVFKALQMSLRSPTGQEGEAWDVLSQLPKDLKKIWIAAATMKPAKPASQAPKAG
jgi:uncharacterized protein (DUF2267 family)